MEKKEYTYQSIGTLEFNEEKNYYHIDIPMTFSRDGKQFDKDYRMTFFEREVNDGKVHERAIADRVKRCVDFFRSRGMGIVKLDLNGMDENIKSSVQKVLDSIDYSVVPLHEKEIEDFQRNKHEISNAKVGLEKEFFENTKEPEREVAHVEIDFATRDQDGKMHTRTRSANFNGKQVDFENEKPKVLGVAIESFLKFQVEQLNKRKEQVLAVDTEKLSLNAAIQGHLSAKVQEQNTVYTHARKVLHRERQQNQELGMVR